MEECFQVKKVSNDILRKSKELFEGDKVINSGFEAIQMHKRSAISIKCPFIRIIFALNWSLKKDEGNGNYRIIPLLVITFIFDSKLFGDRGWRGSEHTFLRREFFRTYDFLPIAWIESAL